MEENANANSTPAKGAGGLALAAVTDGKTRHVAGKKLSKKHATVLRTYCDAEQAPAERETKDWLEKHGFHDDAEEAGREATIARLYGKELGLDLAGKYARKSAKKTGDAIGDIREHYETIASEFRCLREGQSFEQDVVHYEGNRELKQLSRWIEQHIYACVRGERDRSLEGARFTEPLLTTLALEYVRDREGLMRFIKVMFERWRKIDQPHSAWRVEVIIEQNANDVPHHRIAQRLEKADAVPKGTVVPGTDAYRKLRSKIKKRSRGRDEAIKNRILMELRAAGEKSSYETEISERTDFTSATVSDALNNLQRSGKAKWKMTDATALGKVKKIRLWFAVKGAGDKNG